MSSWDSTHVAAAVYMLKYLKHMKDEGLTFRKQLKLDQLSLRIFCDANFEGETIGMRSLSAFAIIVEEVGTVLFLSKQQTTVSKSTMESEYHCASHAAQSFEGYVNLFGQLGRVVNTPAQMLIDNVSTVAAIQTQATSFKLRHLLIDHAYLPDLFFRGVVVSPHHVDGRKHTNPADLGTKCLPADATERYIRFLLDSAGGHDL